MRHDETERLPPTERRGRNGWDFLAEAVRGIIRFFSQPVVWVALLVAAIVAGYVSEDLIEKVVGWVKSLRE